MKISTFKGYIDNVINANNAHIKKPKITNFPNISNKICESNAIMYIYWQVQNLFVYTFIHTHNIHNFFGKVIFRRAIYEV